MTNTTAVQGTTIKASSHNDMSRERLLNLKLVGVVLGAVLVSPASVCAAPQQLPVTQDNSIVLVDGEWTVNAGEQGRIRIKGNQHIVAMDFDTTAITGKRVKQATLVCIPSEESISGVTLSTIATPWDEAKSNGLSAGISGVNGWGSDGNRFPAVMGGNGFTLVHSVQSEQKDGAYHWDVDPDMVHAMAIGIAHGLAIHEHDADYSRNPTIFAREQSGKKPFLLVDLDEANEPAPAPPTRLKLQSIDSSTARLSLKAPMHGFAYDIEINGTPLGRHNIPLVAPGQLQVIPLRDLPQAITSKGSHSVKVVTLSRTGQRSQAAVARAELFKPESISKPKLPAILESTHPVENLAVIPLTDKYDSLGQPVGELPPDYRRSNALFNGERVRLRGAAGEVVGFQLLLRGQGDVSVQVTLDGPATRIDLHQALYVPANERLIPDPLVPLPAKISLQPDADHAIVADLYIPFEAPAGVRRGAITISDGREIPLEVEVLPYALPKRATFFCEMNGYGLPDHVEDYYALQQVAYDHRLHANILHYSHQTAAPGARKSSLDMRLRSGRRMDNKRYDEIQPGARGAYWDDFVEAFGPFLEGSCFQNGHRGAIPAPGFYLTFHESWPLNCRAFFNGDLDAFKAFEAQPAYAQTYVDVLQDFTQLARKQGWTETGFQVYFNNKGSLQEETKAPWILDEPASYWDYRALRFYGELTDRGRSGSKDVPIDYRIDISRPEFCRGQLDRRGDLWVVSSSAFQHYRQLVTDRQERDQFKVWVYGTSNHVHEPNGNVVAWALDAWRFGATGIVPWQTIDKTGQALKQADQLGLFIFDQAPEGRTVIRHSLRLKAFREAQQQIESLNLLKAKRSWSNEQMRRFLAQFVELDPEVHKTSEEDAGTTVFAGFSTAGFQSLRHATAELLMQP